MHGLTLVSRIPAPQTHDEFGYLLLGDTFAHGRVTNPTPPLWEHFETIHEIMQPTYTAKYPPGAGLGAGGWRSGSGSPSLGCGCDGPGMRGDLLDAVWRGCRRAGRWRAAAAAFHPQVLEWSQNYWGGAVAMGGGALVLVSFRRILREPRAWDAIVMGAGIILLAISRPYEGLVVCLLTGVAMLVWILKTRRPGVRKFFLRIMAPLAVMMVLLACVEGFYDLKTTGNPLVMPYMVHIDTYGIDPVFVFSVPRREPVFRHREIKNLQENYLEVLPESAQFLARAFEGDRGEARGPVGFLFMVAAAPGATLGLSLGDQEERSAPGGIPDRGVLSSGLLVETWMHAHYAAPAAAIYFLRDGLDARGQHLAFRGAALGTQFIERPGNPAGTLLR